MPLLWIFSLSQTPKWIDDLCFLGANDLRQSFAIAFHIRQFTHANPAPIGVSAIDSADEDFFGLHPLTDNIRIHTNIDPNEIGG